MLKQSDESRFEILDIGKMERRAGVRSLYTAPIRD